MQISSPVVLQSVPVVFAVCPGCFAVCPSRYLQSVPVDICSLSRSIFAEYVPVDICSLSQSISAVCPGRYLQSVPVDICSLSRSIFAESVPVDICRVCPSRYLQSLSQSIFAESVPVKWNGPGSEEWLGRSWALIIYFTFQHNNNRGLSYTSWFRPDDWQLMTMVGFGSLLQSSWLRNNQGFCQSKNRVKTFHTL